MAVPEEYSNGMSKDIASAMEALAAIDGTKKSKHAGKKKVKKRVSKGIAGQKSRVVVEEFEYRWPTCVCGHNHPPVPLFKPPDGKKCNFYWQLADMFPFMSIHRILTTELKFVTADVDQSGLIELGELKTLLNSTIGDVTDRMVEITFKEIDGNGSGNIDFTEVLNVIDTLIQRRETNLPTVVQKEYSKACSIQ